jgi:Uma2 family endonuclease
MPRLKHQRLSGKIYKYLSDLLENCPYCEAFLPVDWQICENTVVQPDVLVVCEENIENIDGEKLLIPPVLVFEILSPSTAQKDRVLKYQLYEKAGVKYYFIVDADARSTEVFELNRDGYRAIDTNTFKDGTMTLDFGKCAIEIEFSKILK